MKLVVSSRLYLVFSGLLILLVCIFLGCGQQGKEYGDKSNELQLQVENKKQKVEAKEQPKIQPKKETNQIEPELSKKEKKRIEKRVLEVVDRLEDRYKKGLYKDITKREDESEIEKERLQTEKEYKEFIEVGKVNIPTLIKVIKDKRRSSLFRTALIRMIVDDIAKDKRLINPLIEIVRDRKEDIILRNEAKVILKEDFGKIIPEVTLSEKEKKKIRKKVLSLIASMEWKCKIMRLLERNDTPDFMGVALTTQIEWEQLEHIGKPAIPVMMDVLKDKKKDWIVRWIISYLAGTGMSDMIDSNACKSMIEVLEDKTDNLTIRTDIANRLGNIGDKIAVEPLIRVLEDREEMMNTKEGNTFLLFAILSLGRLKDGKAKDVLIDIIKETMGSDELQGPALGALEDIGEKEKTIELAIWMLNEPNCRYSDTAACVLGNFKGDKRAIESLKETLKNKKKHEFTRCSIVIGLGKLKQVDTLIEIIRTEDKNSLAIEDAIKSLTKIGDKKAIEVLKEVLNDPTYDSYYRETAAIALEYFNNGKEPYWFKDNIY